MMSSCAVKQESGCKYTIKKMPENIWKIEVENGSFAAFTPLVEKKAKKNLPVIKKNDKEIFLFFASKGSLTQNKNGSSFTYKQNVSLNIPEKKAEYIEETVCSNDKTVIKSNGAVVFYNGVLYNGRKYIDIYNISLKQNYIHSNKCFSVSAPVSLSFPKRVRYFLNYKNHNLYSNGKNIIISNDNNDSQMYLTDITPYYTTIILKGRYEPLQNIPYSKFLKGSVFKQVIITSKSEVTEIRLYAGTMVKEQFISIDKVDNNIIIYAGR